MHVQHLQLGEQRLADQLAERAHDADFGTAGPDPVHGPLIAHPGRLVKLDAELAGGRGHRARERACVPALGGGREA